MKELKELSDMTFEEIKEIIAVGTSEGEILFLEDVLIITKNEIQLKNNRIFSFRNNEAYNDFIEKYTHYKIFMTRQPNTIDVKKLTQFESDFNQLVESSFIEMKKSIDDKITKSLSNLQTTIDNISSKSEMLVKDTQWKIDKINIDELNNNISKLENIITILDGIVDD